jgi:hypothetical protein
MADTLTLSSQHISDVLHRAVAGYKAEVGV